MSRIGRGFILTPTAKEIKVTGVGKKRCLGKDAINEYGLGTEIPTNNTKMERDMEI